MRRCGSAVLTFAVVCTLVGSANPTSAYDLNYARILFSSADPNFRTMALDEIIGMASTRGDISPALDLVLAALDDPAPLVQIRAVDALETYGLPVPEAVPGLRRLLSKSNFRASVVRALGIVTAGRDECAQDIVVALSDEDPDVRQAALRALWRIGPGGAAAVPRLTTMLVQHEASKEEILCSLARIGPSARVARQVVASLLPGADEAHDAQGTGGPWCSSPETILRLIEMDCSDPVPDLARATRGTDPRLREGAASILADFYAKRPEARAAFIDLAMDADQTLREIPWKLTCDPLSGFALPAGFPRPHRDSDLVVAAAVSSLTWSPDAGDAIGPCLFLSRCRYQHSYVEPSPFLLTTLRRRFPALLPASNGRCQDGKALFVGPVTFHGSRRANVAVGDSLRSRSVADPGPNVLTLRRPFLRGWRIVLVEVGD